MADRRRLRLIRWLIATTHGRSVARLERLFGQHVHDLLRELFLANHTEYDAGERVRLTMAGRNHARLALGLNVRKKHEAAA